MFFSYPSYREFLADRFKQMKASKPQFSSRYFARKAGIKSASYFGMVVKGERRLTHEFADRFATGLHLSGFERDCLLACVDLDNATKAEDVERHRRRLEKLKSARNKECRLIRPSQIELLADLTNLKLYLLAQSEKFRLSANWIQKQFDPELATSDLEARIAALFDSGLWTLEGNQVRTIAPTVKTGDQASGGGLRRMHENALAKAREALIHQTPATRIFGGRDFLFDRRRIRELEAKIQAFRDEVEKEFEDLQATEPFRLQVDFFKL